MNPRNLVVVPIVATAAIAVTMRLWNDTRVQVSAEKMGDNQPTQRPSTDGIPEFNPPDDEGPALEIAREFEHTLALDHEYSQLERKIRTVAESAPEAVKAELERRLLLLENVYYFQAATDNSGQVYTMWVFLNENQADFREIGATGCLKALEGLRAFHLKSESLASDEAKRNHLFSTEAERKEHERLAEDTDRLLELMISFARSTLELAEPPSKPPAEQHGTDQPATRSESKSEDNQKPQLESDWRSL